MTNSDKNSSNPTDSGVVPNVAKNTGIKRGGRGSKGEPSEIKESITKAQEDVVRIDLTLSKLKNEKEGLLRTIADFRIKERQLVEKGLTTDVADIRKAITKAQNEVDKINGVVPESVALDDHRKIQSIVSEYYAERQKAKDAAEKIKQAEKKLEVSPSDGRAMGDAIRGETEKVEAEELLAEAERQAELILKNSMPNPVRDESVHHTNEETINERNYLNKRHAERVTLGVFDQKKESEEIQKEIAEVAVPENVEETEKVSELQATQVSNNVSVYDEAVKVIPESAPLQSAYNVAMDRLSKEAETKENIEPEKINVGNIGGAEVETEHVDDSLLPIIMEPMPLVTTVTAKEQEASKEPGTLDLTNKLQTILSAIYHFPKKISAILSGLKKKPAVEPVVDTYKPATEEILTQTESQTTEQAEEIITEGPEAIIEPGEFLEKPLFTEFESSDQQDVVVTSEQTIIPPNEPAVPEVSVAQEEEYVITASDTPATQEPLPEEQDSAVTQEYVPLMPQEIIPGSHDELSQIESQADEVLRDDIDKLFGESKFLGFKHIHGLDSINWKDPQVGFEGKTVTEILSANPTEEARTFGVENLEATNKLKSYINNVISMSEVNPSEDEKVADFIRRASIAKLSK